MLVLPSTAQSITKVENYVRRISSKYDIGDDHYPNILISLTEAVNNAITHGNGEDQSKSVNIDMARTDTGLAFRISDEGLGFDPESIPDPTSNENIECCGGRGVFLMKQLSDRINFHDNGRTVEIFFDL